MENYAIRFWGNIGKDAILFCLDMFLFVMLSGVLYKKSEDFSHLMIIRNFSLVLEEWGKVFCFVLFGF